MGPVIVMHSGGFADADLVQALEACGAAVRFATTVDEVVAQSGDRPPAVLLELDELDEPDSTLFPTLISRLPASTRLIALGDPRSVTHEPELAPPDCVVFGQPDEATLRGLLTAPVPVSAEVLLNELLTLSVFGEELPEHAPEAGGPPGAHVRRGQLRGHPARGGHVLHGAAALG